MLYSFRDRSYLRKKKKKNLFPRTGSPFFLLFLFLFYFFGTKGLEEYFFLTVCPRLELSYQMLWISDFSYHVGLVMKRSVPSNGKNLL